MPPKGQQVMRIVLIVDDEPKICRLLSEFFKHRGYDARTAMSGREALAIIEQQPPDIILLDVRMPEMSGLEVLERLRRRHPTLPVVIITAAEDLATEEAAQRLGASDYVRKPFSVDEPAWARAFFTEFA